MNPSTYQQALDYLYSFVDYSLKHADELARAEFNLDRMRRLLSLLGDPHRAYPAIHIAGTKGKGSTAAITASVLRAAGYRVGLYTSPHLEDFTERIQVDGQPIPPERLAALVDEIKPAVAQVPYLTTFELTTALGFLYFARQGVDAAVIEVGLGGRLDATNVLEAPLVSVITPLSLDHTAVLGDTLAQIAAEKGGIIKEGRPVVVAPQPPEALAVLTEIAARRQAPLLRVDEHFRWQRLTADLSGQTFRLSTPEGRAQTLRLPLLGPHQLENAATACAALEVAAAEGLPLPDKALAEGLAAVRWPGRFEVFRRQPLVILDGAHNEAAAIRLAQTLKETLPGRKAVLVFGVSEDKDAAAMLHRLSPHLAEVIFSRAAHPRALPAAALAARYGPALSVPYRAVEPVEAAVQQALAAVQQAPQQRYLLSAGSLFLTAAVRTVLKETDHA